MGGQSSSTQTQQSQSAPWEAAQPMLQGILGQLNPLIQNSGLNSTESNAISQLSQNAAQGNPYASQIGGFVSNLFNGGGATAQAPALQNGLSTLQSQLTPYANGSMIGNNPALQAQLDQIASDTTNQVNSQFAAAGRDGSGMNQQTLARGIAQGEAPVIAGQYNQDVANQLSAANALYGAQNSTSGLLSGLTQQGLANQLQGVTSSQDALNAQNYTPQQQLALAQLAQSIPAQNLGLLAQIGVPIAQLGTQSTSNTQGTQQLSGAQQFATLASGIGSLLSGGGNLLKNLPSDRRLKEEIAQVGALFDGTPVYGYRYKGAPAYHIGLMAQDVEKTTPAAVVEINGYKAVDYRAATEASRRIGPYRACVSECMQRAGCFDF
jgi:Chaperone of endosialidase